MCAWNCTTVSTGTSFLIQPTLFSLLLFPVQTEHLRIWCEHKQKTFRSKVILQCGTHPLEQAARQASPSNRHCFLLSVVAEITFVCNFVIPSSFTLRLPPLIVIPPLSIFFARATSMWFSCTESDCALQVDTDTDLWTSGFASKWSPGGWTFTDIDLSASGFASKKSLGGWTLTSTLTLTYEILGLHEEDPQVVGHWHRHWPMKFWVCV